MSQCAPSSARTWENQSEFDAVTEKVMHTVFHAQSTSLDFSHSTTARHLPQGVQEFCLSQSWRQIFNPLKNSHKITISLCS